MNETATALPAPPPLSRAGMEAELLKRTQHASFSASILHTVAAGLADGPQKTAITSLSHDIWRELSNAETMMNAIAALHGPAAGPAPAAVPESRSQLLDVADSLNATRDRVRLVHAACETPEIDEFVQRAMARALADSLNELEDISDALDSIRAAGT